MTQLYTSLSENFAEINGGLIGYNTLALAPITPRNHYDIRSFHNDNVTVPNTMLDLKFNNVFSLDTTQMIVLDQPRIFSGPSFAASLISQLDSIHMNILDTEDMNEIELKELTGGNENWPIGDANVTVGKDSTMRYANTIAVTLTGGVSKTVSSSYRDNLSTSFGLAGVQYFVELALPGFPAQAAASHLDLTNSFIDFSSDAGYASGSTDTFSFSQSLIDLTAGGNTYFKINRSSFVNSNLSDITNIQFRLKSVGNMTFKAAAMRLVTNNYTFDSTDIDTKRSTFGRSVPQDGATELSTPTTPVYIQTFTRPKNITLVAKFNSGTLPTGGNSSLLTLYTRVAASTYCKLDLTITSSATTLHLYDSSVLSLSTSPPTLTANTDYILVLKAYETSLSASIFKSFGAFYGSQVGSTLTGVTTVNQRGFIGFGLNPYNYDLSIDYITAGDTEFGRFESTDFPSPKFVGASTLGGVTSQPINLVAGDLIAAGDATVNPSSTLSGPGPFSDTQPLQIVRTGASFQGGLVSKDRIEIGNSNYIQVSGDIFPAGTVRGDYRIAFVNKYGSVGYLGYIRNLQASQWNHFEFPLNTTLIPDEYSIYLQQDGFYNDTFSLVNFQVNTLTVAWQVSPNNGTTWYPFLTAIDDFYSAVNFKSNPGNDLKVRAIAVSDNSWVAHYELIPHYQLIGHYLFSGRLGQGHSIELDFSQIQNLNMAVVNLGHGHYASFSLAQAQAFTASLHRNAANVTLIMQQGQYYLPTKQNVRTISWVVTGIPPFLSGGQPSSAAFSMNKLISRYTQGQTPSTKKSVTKTFT